MGLASGLLNSHSVGSCAGESVLAGRLAPVGVGTAPAGDRCAGDDLIRRCPLFGRAYAQSDSRRSPRASEDANCKSQIDDEVYQSLIVAALKTRKQLSSVTSRMVESLAIAASSIVAARQPKLELAPPQRLDYFDAGIILDADRTSRGTSSVTLEAEPLLPPT